MVASYVYASYSYHFQTYPRIAGLKMEYCMESYNCSTATIVPDLKDWTPTESPKVSFPLATSIAWYFHETLVQR